MDAKQPESTHSAVSHSADISGSNIFPRVAESALEPRTTFLRYPAITHFAVLAALFTPLAAVPYLLSKKRISALSRKLDKVSTTTAALRIELESSAVERVKQRTELSATTSALRRELETFAIESAKQRKELSATATALRKELEASAIENDKQKEEFSITTAALRRELRASADESAKQKEELNRTSASLEAARMEVTRLHGSIEQLHAEHEAFETTTESVQQLLQERKLTSERLALLPLLGNSLADVAAFMYNAELHQGITSGSTDGRRGVERLRRLALELQIVRSERPK